MRERQPIISPKGLAFAVLALGAMALPVTSYGADLRELLLAQAELQRQAVTGPENEPENESEPEPQQEAQSSQNADPATTAAEEGFLNTLSDFLADEGAGNDALIADPADDEGFGDAGTFEGDDVDHYEGAELEPEESNLFDDAFGVGNGPSFEPQASDAFDSEFGPAPDDAPEEFAPEDVEAALADETGQPDKDLPDGVDIFGNPKQTEPKAAEAQSDFAFDLSDMAPVNLDVPANTTVTVRALDKITAKMSEHKLKVNTPYNFGTLAITLRTCSKTPPEETPEATAYLEILDNRPDIADENREWFRGWMFASSPAISALEHPVYDVWVIDCNIVSTSADDDSR